MATHNEAEIIKKKLTNLAEDVRRNLLSSATNVTRKFVLEEHDFLSIILLAIQHLHGKTKERDKDKEHNKNHSSASPIKDENKDDNDNNDNNEIAVNDTNEKGGGNATNTMDVEKLRKEFLRILHNKSFNEDAQSYMLMDILNRHESQARLARERKIMSTHIENHPNVLKGGSSKAGTENHRIAEHVPCDKNDTAEQAATKRRDGSKVENNIDNVQTKDDNTSLSHPNYTNQSSSHVQLQNTVEVWIRDAVKVVTTYMKKKANKIFLQNLKVQAFKLQDYLKKKGTFNKKR